MHFIMLWRYKGDSQDYPISQANTVIELSSASNYVLTYLFGSPPTWHVPTCPCYAHTSLHVRGVTRALGGGGGGGGEGWV